MKTKYMTTSEVAIEIGVTRSTVAAYSSRGQMPEPDVVYGRTPLWKTVTISRWTKDRKGK